MTNPDAFADRLSLGQAIKQGDLESVQEHLARGVDPNQEPVALATALRVSSHRDELVNRLDFNELRSRVAEGDDEMILQYLLEVFEKPFEQQDRSKAQQPAIVDALLKAGADPNLSITEGNTPLHVAMRERAHPEVVRSLLAAGADVHARNEYGDTPLEEIASMDRRDVQPESVRALVEHGATIDPMLVGHLASQDRTRDVRVLLDLGFDLQTRGPNGLTVLHRAFGDQALHPSEPTVRLLLQRGADPTALNDKGQTPIDLATRQGDLGVVGLLGAARREREALATPPERIRYRSRERS